MRYIGFIPKRSAISHKSAANIVIVDEFDVTCVITLMTNTQRSVITGCDTPICTSNLLYLVIIINLISQPF